MPPNPEPVKRIVNLPRCRRFALHGSRAGILINGTHFTPAPVPCEARGHADRHATDAFGDDGMVRRELQGRRADADGAGPQALRAGGLARSLRSALASARWMLPKLAGALGAPAGGGGDRPRPARPSARPVPDCSDSDVACALRGLGALSRDPVTDAEDRSRRAMVGTHHPAGAFRHRGERGRTPARAVSGRRGLPPGGGEGQRPLDGRAGPGAPGGAVRRAACQDLRSASLARAASL